MTVIWKTCFCRYIIKQLVYKYKDDQLDNSFKNNWLWKMSGFNTIGYVVELTKTTYHKQFSLKLILKIYSNLDSLPLVCVFV